MIATTASFRRGRRSPQTAQSLDQGISVAEIAFAIDEASKDAPAH
jgi:hypothetical protein